MKLTRTIVLIVIALTMCVAGCNREGSKLVGTWKNQTMPETVEFNKDKTGLFMVKDQPALPFTWAMTDSNVRIDVAYQGKVQTLFGRMDNKSLILEGKGQQAVYTKTD